MGQKTVGFIGLGKQGAPIAHRIEGAGIPLVVWARSASTLEPFAARSVRIADSVADLAGQCDQVSLCVVNDADVMQICEQLIPAMRTGSHLVIHSTIRPDTCTELDRRCVDRGIGLVDAPVSGGPDVAAAGALTIMCGARQEDYNAVLPVFRSFGKLIKLLGEPGAGQRAKIINNSLLAANMGVACAAMAAASSQGIDRAALTEVILASSGRSMGFEVFSQLGSPTDFSFGAPLLRKDVDLLAAAQPENESTELLRTAADFFLAQAMGTAGQD